MQTSPIKTPFQQSRKPMGVEAIFQILSEIKAMKKELQAEIEAGKKERENIASLVKQVKEIQRGEKGEKGEPAISHDQVVKDVLRRIEHPSEDLIVQKVQSRIKVPVDGKSVKMEDVVRELSGYLPTAEEVAAKIPPPKNGDNADPEKFLALLKKKKLGIEHIADLKPTLDALKYQTGKAYLHGSGVPSLTAGSGIVLTRTSDGGYSVSAPGGAITFYTDTVAGTINGVNTAFTVSNTISSAVALFLGGVPYQLNVDYTVSGTNLTFTTAPGASLSGQPFFLIHT